MKFHTNTPFTLGDNIRQHPSIKKQRAMIGRVITH